MSDAAPNLPDDDWLLLYDVRALVAEHTKSAPAAEGLLLDWWRTKQPRIRRHLPGGKIEMGPYHLPRPDLPSLLGLEIVVDFDNSRIVEIRHEVLRGSAAEVAMEALEPYRRGLPPPPVRTLALVCWQRRDVLAALRAVGLLGPERLTAKPVLTVEEKPNAAAPSPSNSEPTSPIPESVEPQSTEPPPSPTTTKKRLPPNDGETCREWLGRAIPRCRQEPEELDSAYGRRLRDLSGDKWEESTVKNNLIIYRKTARAEFSRRDE